MTLILRATCKSVVAIMLSLSVVAIMLPGAVHVRCTQGDILMVPINLPPAIIISIPRCRKSQSCVTELIRRSYSALLKAITYGIPKRTFRARKARSYLFQSTEDPLGLARTNGIGRSSAWLKITDADQFGAALKKTVLLRLVHLADYRANKDDDDDTAISTASEEGVVSCCVVVNTLST